jgi:hypothetical protein
MQSPVYKYGVKELDISGFSKQYVLDGDRLKVKSIRYKPENINEHFIKNEKKELK